MTKDLLNKFINNACSEEELRQVLQWAKTEALTEEARKLVYDDWQIYREEDNLADDDRFNTLFDKIQEEIDKRDRVQEQAETRTLPTVTKWLTRAAAILLIPVLALFLYTLSENKALNSQFGSAAVDSLEIISPIGSRTVVQLSDGSQVHLNYGSKIKYPQFFVGNTREVILEGEGFFEVAHNPEKPFIVKTGGINVKALGTSFNVMDYDENDEVQTTLVTGKVVLEQENADGDVHIIGSMEPGQHVTYHKLTSKISSSKGNIEKYIAWKDGKLVFEDTPILEVAENLSRMFNVSIEIDQEIEDYFYTVTFIDEPLFQILDLMTIATPVQYQILPRKKLSDGTYSKLKIIIEKKDK